MSKELIELYNDPGDSRSCDVGRILLQTDDFLILEAVDTTGHHNGLVFCTDDIIYKIGRGTQYLQKIELLESFTEQPDSNYEPFKFCKDIQAFLQLCQQNHYIVSVDEWENGEFDQAGFVHTFDDEWLELTALDFTTGEPDGTYEIRLKSITEICVQSSWCRGLEALHKHFTGR